jgi:hypothetical protein
MAKGWESKSVESQVQDSQEKARDKRGMQLTPAQIDNRRRREVLVLSQTRVQRGLELSQDPRYRDHLARALADIDAQIAALDELAIGNS